MGILAVGERAGAIDFGGAPHGAVLLEIFPGVPRDHPANGLIVMNYSANFLGWTTPPTPSA
jgi:spore maturation protein SpmA